MDRLTPLDAWFLAVEDGIDHMHMALVCVLEGPCPTLDEIRADMEGRLDRLPRYRQRVVHAPFDLTSPVWADDASFDIANHVRALGVREPGDDAALAEVVGEVITDELDRAHPLWDICTVDGLANDEWAAIIRVHHCLTDGVGGSELMATLVDVERTAEPPARSEWRPARAPTPLRLLADAARRSLHPLQAASWLAKLARSPSTALRTARDATAGLVALGHDLPPTRPTVLNGPLGPARTWEAATTTMADVDAIRSAHDVTVNDVALAAIAGGMADLLEAHGESVADRDVRCLVPVSLRAEREGALHNRVAAMVADLPVGIGDPVARLREVHARMSQLKASHEADTTAWAVEASEHLPWLPVTTTFRLVVRLLHTFVQRNVNAVTTNVPGPPVPLYWMGRQILRSHPVTPIGESVRLGVAIHSYNGLLTFGVTADRAALPDVSAVVAGIERDLAAMAAAAGNAAGPPRLGSASAGA